jgi:hypothetical protein
MPDDETPPGEPAPPEAPEAATPVPPPPPMRLSRWSRGLLAAISLLIAAVTIGELATMFLEAAPSNTVSARYQAQVSWWVEPWLEQDWQLFAPVPQSSNTTIEARARGANGVVSGWVDLTAADYAAIAHDPMPSQLNQNQLRRAWSAYTAAVPASQFADTARGKLLEQYVANIAAQRLAASVPGPYQSVQLEAVDTPITPPGATAKNQTSRMTPWLAP